MDIEKDGKKIRIVASACCVLLLGISIYFTYNFFDLNIASNTICFIIILITILLVAETFLLSRKSKTAKIAIAMALIFSLLLGLAGYYLRVSSKALEKMTGVATSVDTIGLYVDESSKIELPEELRNARIGILETMGRDITDKGIQKLDKVITEDHKYVEYEDVATLTDALIEGDSEAIFINTAYYTLLSEIAEETYQFYLKEIEEYKKKQEETKE